MVDPACRGGADRGDVSPRPQLVIAGNPNVGKTTLFIALTGLSAKVSNYPGITVEKRSGILKLASGPADLHAVSQWLGQNGWTIVTSELGYVAKNFPVLSNDERAQAGEFLQTLEDHDDVHRVWAALK